MGFFLLVLQGFSCLSRDMNGFFECDKTATNFSNFPLCLCGFLFLGSFGDKEKEP